MELSLTSHLETDFITKDGLTVPLGTTNGYFRLAANGTTTNAGLYTLQYDKGGDDDN